MKTSTYFTPKYKLVIHVFVFIMSMWAILETLGYINIMHGGHDDDEYYKFYWSIIVVVEVFTIYILSLWILPLFIENKRKGALYFSIYTLLYVLSITWLRAKAFTNISFEGKEYASPYIFLNIDWIYTAFLLFIPFIVISFIYSFSILSKKQLKRLFYTKRSELWVNIIAVCIIFFYALSIGSTPNIREILALALFIIVFYLNAFFIAPVLTVRKKYGLWALLLLSLILFFLTSSYLLGYLSSYRLYTFYFYWLISLVAILLVSTIYGHQRIKAREKDILLSAKQSELSLLKSQVNPHFLFNTLNTLYATALEENAPKTAESIAKLASLIRYMQNDIKKNFIPLENEITYLKDYITIQKLRCEVTPEIITNFQNIEGKIISPGLLIPFVENAFKYGIDPSKQSKLALSVTGDEKSINFECTNSYDIEFKTYYKERGFGIGITNTRQRLQLVYPKNHTLVITRGNHVFTVKLSIFITA